VLLACLDSIRTAIGRRGRRHAGTPGGLSRRPSSSTPRRSHLIAASLILVLVTSASALADPTDAGAAPLDLTVTRTQPVIWINDSPYESGFDAPYIAALAAAGDINLLRMYSNASRVAAPYARGGELLDYENGPSTWRALFAQVFRHTPPWVPGASHSLDDPAYPGPSAAALEMKRLIDEADEPVVIVTGSPLTEVAELLRLGADTTKFRVYAQAGNVAPNGEDILCDAWNCGQDRRAFAEVNDHASLDIVFFTYRQGEIEHGGKPYTPSAGMTDEGYLSYVIPPSPLREFMRTLVYAPRNDELEYAYDADPIVALHRRDYVLRTRTLAPGDEVYNGAPVFKPGAKGKRFVFPADKDQAAADHGWWSALSNPAAYGDSAPVLP
jgi:hypothetical protein